MQISIQTSPLYSDLLGDEEIAGILASSTEIRAMIRVELALAQAQSEIGMIPGSAGVDLAAALAEVDPDMRALARVISDSSIPVPALLAELRKAGGSSTMPQKANPIQSEMVAALGTTAQALHGCICAVASPVEERAGASWSVRRGPPSVRSVYSRTGS